MRSKDAFCSSCGANLREESRNSGDELVEASTPQPLGDDRVEEHTNPAKVPELSETEIRKLKGPRRGRAWLFVFAAVIALAWVWVQISVSSPPPRHELLAQEVCDVSIIYGPVPSSDAGRKAWQEFEEKGSELAGITVAGELVFIGLAAEQLASATATEVNLGGGRPPYFGLDDEMVYWYEEAGEYWQTAANYWAELCLQLD